MKKSVNVKSAIIAVIAIAIFVCASALLFANGAFNSKAEDDLKTPIFKVGKYIYEGNEPWYFEFFDDNTVQLVGFDAYEFNMRNPENVENLKNMSEEQKKYFMEEDNKQTEIWARRNPYIVMPEVPNTIILVDEKGNHIGRAIKYIDENTLGNKEDEYHYVYAEE